MEALLIPLAALACPVGMVLMMWFMGKAMTGGKKDPAEADEVERLRAEQARLSSEVERLERERVPGRDLAAR